ncbi:MAG: Dam family site-specific DNA-(adenine-N6)-methyltransferase [Thermoguttaceae bacterium]
MSVIMRNTTRNGQLSVPHPIPYQGSKRLIAPEILCFFPENLGRLVEPFAGSAAISIAAAARGLTNCFWINDAHQPLVNLWQEIIFHTELLADAYEKHWLMQQGREREYFNFVRSQFNKTGNPADFLYLLARCVKAAIRYNSSGEFNNTPDHRRKGTRPEEMRNRLLKTASLLRNRVKLTAYHYIDVLEQCNENDLVYLDPPYQGVCGNRDQRYCPKFDRDEFYAAIEQLNRRHICFIISYDGRTGEKVYGEPLPKEFHLSHYEITAGRSTQATLLGRNEETVESLYVSKNMINII